MQQLEAASAQAAEVTPCSWSMTLRGANERLVPLGNAYISGLYVSKKDPYKSGRWADGVSECVHCVAGVEMCLTAGVRCEMDPFEWSSGDAGDGGGVMKVLGCRYSRYRVQERPYHALGSCWAVM